MSLFKNFPRLFLYIAIITFLTSSVSFSQGKKYPVNVSLWYNSLSLNKSDKDTATFNLSLFQTNLGSIQGVGIGVAYTVTQNDIKGVNFNGGITRIKGNLTGLSLSGLGNGTNGMINGLQIGGLANMGRSKLFGGQISGVFNYLVEDMKGFQMSLVVNIASSNIKGLQIGNSNIIGENLEGAQIGTTFNAVLDNSKGIQIAPGNYAGKSNLGQLGLINIAGKNKGLQLGLINIADDQDGIPVGVVNVATNNGGIEWVTYTGNFETIATGVKLRAGKFISILEGGYDVYDSEDDQSWTLGAHYGYDFELAKYYKISPDIGYVQIFDSKKGSTQSEFAIQGRVLGQVALNKTIRFFAGLGWSQTWEIKDSGDTNSGKFIYLAGFSLF